jgi:hypothetical protein
MVFPVLGVMLAGGLLYWLLSQTNKPYIIVVTQRRPVAGEIAAPNAAPPAYQPSVDSQPPPLEAPPSVSPGHDAAPPP